VVRGPKKFIKGIEAVIDKDLTSGLMANVLGIEEVMILTAVSRVAVHFGTPQERGLSELTLSEIRTYHQEGHFLPGSMGPKVEAAIRFLERGGKRVIIAHLEDALPALQGKAGTHIIADGK
jgi:carbamate kinase